MDWSTRPMIEFVRSLVSKRGKQSSKHGTSLHTDVREFDRNLSQERRVSMVIWASKWTEASLSMLGASTALLPSKGTPDQWVNDCKVSSISYMQSNLPWLHYNHPSASERKTLGQWVKKWLKHRSYWVKKKANINSVEIKQIGLTRLRIQLLIARY